MPQTTEHFTVEFQGDICVVQLRPVDKIVFGDFQAMQSLFELLQDLHARRQKVLLIKVESGVLAPEVVDQFWEAVRAERPVRGARREPPRQRLVTFFNTAIERLLPQLLNLDTIVVTAFQGQVDLDLFGTLLVSDYRICTEDTVLANRVLEQASPPGSALVWSLCRYLGFGAAQDILMEGRSLTASEARELRLVNRVVTPAALEEESVSVARNLAAKPAAALVNLKRSFQHVDTDFATYLRSTGAGFDSLPG